MCGAERCNQWSKRCGTILRYIEEIRLAQTAGPDGLFPDARPLQICTQIAMDMVAADLRQWLVDKGRTHRGAAVAVTPGSFYSHAG